MRVDVSAAWRQAFPFARVGVVLVRNVQNTAHTDQLDTYLVSLEAELRRRYADADRARLAGLQTIRAYQQHYRAFGQTYHLLGQLESVVLKGRPLKSPGGALVTAMFAAEIDNLLLTAGHDADLVAGDVAIDCSRDGETYVGISGRAHVLKAGDMLMRDRDGIISAVLTGPDQRTRLAPTSTSALYVTYAPSDVAQPALAKHQADLVQLVRLAQPEADLAALEIYPT
jgi:DNA/RNA-binding domain of Phe-tRNA-synthetase-like protein